MYTWKKSENRYDNQEINYSCDSQSKENNHNIQRDKEDITNNSLSVAAFTNYKDKRMVIEKGHEDSDEEYKKYEQQLI